MVPSKNRALEEEEYKSTAAGKEEAYQSYIERNIRENKESEDSIKIRTEISLSMNMLLIIMKLITLCQITLTHSWYNAGIAEGTSNRISIIPSEILVKAMPCFKLLLNVLSK